MRSPPLVFLTEAEWDLLMDDIHLSPRERDVVGQVLCGHSEDQVAGILGIKRDTIRTYVKRIYLKTGATSRASLALHLFALYAGRARKESSSM